ncbi:MAG TPA: ATP-binding protein [Solirubrobacteraceae bacterium]
MRSAGPVRGLRMRLLLAVVAVVGVGLAALTVGFNVLLARQLDGDLDSVLRARAAAQLTTLSVVDGRLELSEAPDEGALDSQVWVFAGSRELERPARAPAAVERAVRALSGSPRRTLDLRQPPIRLLAVPVQRAGRRLGTVVVGASRVPYEHTRRAALVASLALAVVLLAATTLLARWLVGAALRPVKQMTEDAARWSERDLDRRFGLGEPTDELTRLAATLDGLLDRLSAGMRREQRFSTELSHELRTPLAKLTAQAQLLAGSDELPDALRPEAASIVASATQMRRVLDALMAAARAELDGARGRGDAVRAARAVVDAYQPLAHERGVALTLGAAPPSARAGAERELVERMLTPLIENALRLAAASVTLEIALRDGTVQIAVADDGPGVAPDETAAIFEPGRRGTQPGDHAGAGLGLALARRLARSAGGDVTAEAGSGGRFVVRLPSA